MYLAKEATYHSPQGDHRARVLNAIHDIKGHEVIPKHEVRMTFTLPDIKDRMLEYRVGRTYKETDAIELRHDLCVLMGDNVDELVDEDGMLHPEKLSLLKGRECMISVEHIHNGKHPKPFVRVYNLRELKAPEKLS